MACVKLTNHCDGHNHRLTVIIACQADRLSKTVVRWCQDCGAVVVDTDYDGRTKPGQMQFPTYEFAPQTKVRKIGIGGNHATDNTQPPTLDSSLKKE